LRKKITTYGVRSIGCNMQHATLDALHEADAGTKLRDEWQR